MAGKAQITLGEMIMPQTRSKPDRGSPPSTPRWVKVLGIVALVAILLLIIVMLIVGGEHGPGRHRAIDANDGIPALALVAENVR